LVFEELPGRGRRAEVDLATFVEDGGLVEYVVDGLTGLVHGHCVGADTDVRGYAQGLDELEGAGRVETAGAVVPCADWRLGEHHLGDTNALAFASGYAADKVVADFGVVGVGESEHGHDDTGNVATVFGAGHVVDSVGRCAHGCSELEGLAYC